VVKNKEYFRMVRGKIPKFPLCASLVVDSKEPLIAPLDHFSEHEKIEQKGAFLLKNRQFLGIISLNRKSLSGTIKGSIKSTALAVKKRSYL
jgi:hypothetical protein